MAQQQSITAVLKGEPELRRALNDIIHETRDLRPAWERFYRPAFHDAMRVVFQRKQAGTWRPLKKRYAAWKAAHGGGDPMVLTGALRDSLASTTGESFFRPKEQQMTIGSTNIPTNTPRGRMVVWAENPEMLFQIRRAAQQHVDWYAEKWGRRL
jgi:hypothetical protein